MEQLIKELRKEELEEEELKKKTGENIRKIIANVGVWFLSALFIWWGWNTLAYHLNLFALGYWEVFAIRMAFSSIFKIIGRAFTNK